MPCVDARRNKVMKFVRQAGAPLAALILFFLWAGYAQEDLAPNSNIGFFYFEGFEQLDTRYFRSAYVRVAISWNEFEPEKGKFLWGSPNDQAEKIDVLLSDGKRIFPSIRSKSDWAVRDPKGSKCASAPLDLDTRSKLKDQEIYSPSYYAFVKAVATHYKGRLDTVVIENEMNDNDDFWCSSVDDYLRLFSTAKRAFREVDPSVKLTDGGIQGSVLNWILVQNYLERGDQAAAISFYEKFSGESITQQELPAQVKRNARKAPFIRAQELIRSPLFDWVDLVNFHYYQKADALPEVAAFLRNRIPAGKPLMTNEVGIKKRFVKGSDEAAREMIKKLTHLVALGVKPVIWFSPAGDEENNAGALVNKKGKINPKTKNSFEAAARFLGRPGLACQNYSNPELSKFTCPGSKETLEIIWPRDPEGAPPIRRPSCQAYNYQNRPVKGTTISLEEAPVFITCPSGN